MHATSRSSSKLLHGGLRYLEDFKLGLVKQGLASRDEWIEIAPHLAKPLRINMPIYRDSRRSRWTVGAGLMMYDKLAGKSALPKSLWLNAENISDNDPDLSKAGLLGGFQFSDGQMDDFALGCWVAEQARQLGVSINEDAEVESVHPDGSLVFAHEKILYDRIINVAGPWSLRLLERSGIHTRYRLDPVRGSHLVLTDVVKQAYLLEVPGEKRIFFVLPWKGGTLLGTTEVRQSLEDSCSCSDEEASYLLAAYRRYFPNKPGAVDYPFAGIRPLLHSSDDPNKATREYVTERIDNLIYVIGGKWTTALSLARTVTKMIET